MSINRDQEENLSKTPNLAMSLNFKPGASIFSPKISDTEIQSCSNDRSYEKSFEIIDLVTDFNEKVSLSHSPKATESYEPSSNPSESLINLPKPLESINEPNKSKIINQLLEDVDYIWYTIGISKMMGCFKTLLDKRLRKVINVNRMRTDGNETKIAQEVIPLFKKYSSEYLNGNVWLKISPNGAWVRGLYYKRDMKADTVEEIQSQALAQGIYLRTVSPGYMKAVSY